MTFLADFQAVRRFTFSSPKLELIKMYPEDELQAHTVTRLRGKEYPGNVEGISEPILYEVLKA